MQIGTATPSSLLVVHRALFKETTSRRMRLLVPQHSSTPLHPFAAGALAGQVCFRLRLNCLLDRCLGSSINPTNISCRPRSLFGSHTPLFHRHAPSKHARASTYRTCLLAAAWGGRTTVDWWPNSVRLACLLTPPLPHPRSLHRHGRRGKAAAAGAGVDQAPLCPPSRPDSTRVQPFRPLGPGQRQQRGRRPPLQRRRIRSTSSQGSWEASRRRRSRASRRRARAAEAEEGPPARASAGGR